MNAGEKVVRVVEPLAHEAEQRKGDHDREQREVIGKYVGVTAERVDSQAGQEQSAGGAGRVQDNKRSDQQPPLARAR
jgi:hypothetical protein